MPTSIWFVLTSPNREPHNATRQRVTSLSLLYAILQQASRLATRDTTHRTPCRCKAVARPKLTLLIQDAVGLPCGGRGFESLRARSTTRLAAASATALQLAAIYGKKNKREAAVPSDEPSVTSAGRTNCDAHVDGRRT